MKVYKYLYQKALDKNIIRLAYVKMRKGKTKRPEIKYIDEHYDEEADKMYFMILNTKPDGIKVPNPELAYRPSFIKPYTIKEYGKTREIYKPNITDQWMHHIIVCMLEPIIMARAYRLSCGSIPKKGGIYGKKYIARWIKEGKGIRNFAKLDIRHFFASIDYDVLFPWISTIIQDEWFVYLIKICYNQFKKGLILGFYLSQWLANFFLERLDKYIVQRLKVDKYVRYVDDMVIFHNSKEKLHQSVRLISYYLKIVLHLKLKNNYTVNGFYKDTSINFMGYRFYTYKITIKKNTLYKACSLAYKLYIKKIRNKNFYLKHIRALLSYMGWFKHTNSYKCYITRIKPYVDLGHFKRIISRIDRKKLIA